MPQGYCPSNYVNNNYFPPPAPNYVYNNDPLNSKIMVASIVILFLVVFFILSLHVYAKWFWRHMIRLNFIGQETNSAAAHNIGLDKAAIEQLPTFIYKAAAKAVDEEEALLECAVCLNVFEENDVGRLLPTCKHSFHTDCIDMWFYSHSTCPLCRTVVQSMPTPLSASTASEQQHEQELQQEGSAMEAPLSTHNDPLQPHDEGCTINHGNAKQTQVTSELGLEKPSTSSTTRSIPHITIEIPRSQDNCTSPSNVSRCPSPASDQACSSHTIKSPGLRMSFKNMISRKSSKGKSVFGSNQESEDSAKDTTTSLPVVKLGLCVNK